MKIILNSGRIIENVKTTDNTKSPIGLFIWAINQARDQILTFDKISVRASQIAAILEDDEQENYNPFQLGERKSNNNYEYDARAEQEINISDDDLPL